VKTLADLLKVEENKTLLINWAETGRKVLQGKAQREGIKLAEPDGVENLLKQAEVLAESRIICDSSGLNLADEVQIFWQEIEKRGVLLTQRDYLQASVVALSFQHRFARTDFGTSRQRGFGQSWGDTIQGLLGEIAFTKLVSQATSGQVIPIISADRMEIDEALTADVSKVLIDGKKPIKPAVRVSIKATKLNGRWLDVPYNQTEHSDVFVLVKLGTDADSLFTFLAGVSSLAKVLEVYKNAGLKPLFDKEEEAAEEARRSIEWLASRQHLVLAVVAGWQTKEELQETFTAFCHNGSSAQKRLTVYSGKGSIGTKAERLPEKIRYFPYFEPPDTLKEISFYPIGDFTKTNHSVCSTDLLKTNLDELIRKLRTPQTSTALSPSDIQTGGVPHEDA